ncbi:MAG: hypothetical protein R3C03_16120 [Pirellulaceae bacterium]
MFGTKSGFESRSIGEWLTLPFQYITNFFSFLIHNWSSSRSLKQFLFGAPALLGFFFIVGAPILATYLLAENRQMSAYKARAEMYVIEQDDLESAEVMARKLVAIKPEDLNSYNTLGEILTAQDSDEKQNEASEIMNFASQFSEKSSVKAHLWVANKLLQELNVDDIDVEKRDLAMQHLEFVTANGDPTTIVESMVANLQLANVYFVDDEFEQATKLLHAALDNPYVKTTVDRLVLVKAKILQTRAIRLLVKILEKQERFEQLDQLTNQYDEELLDLAMKIPSQIDPWMTLIELYLASGNYDSANTIVERAVSLAPDSQSKQRLSQLGSLVALRRISKLPKLLDEDSYRLRFLILANAIARNSREPAVYVELLKCLEDDPEIPDQDTWIRKCLVKEIADENAPPIKQQLAKINLNVVITNVVIGFREYLYGNRELAPVLWEQASRQSSQTPLVINNIIQAMAMTWKDFDNSSIEIASLAIKQFPENPLLHFTRGDLYRRNGKLDNARTDLEIVVDMMPKDLRSREILISIYNDLGLNALAKEHQEVANQLQVEALEAEETAMLKANR